MDYDVVAQVLPVLVIAFVFSDRTTEGPLGLVGYEKVRAWGQREIHWVASTYMLLAWANVAAAEVIALNHAGSQSAASGVEKVIVTGGLVSWGLLIVLPGLWFWGGWFFPQRWATETDDEGELRWEQARYDRGYLLLWRLMAIMYLALTAWLSSAACALVLGILVLTVVACFLEDRVLAPRAARTRPSHGSEPDAPSSLDGR